MLRRSRTWRCSHYLYCTVLIAYCVFTQDSTDCEVLFFAPNNETVCIQSTAHWQHEPPLIPHGTSYDFWAPAFESHPGGLSPLPRTRRVVVVMTTIPRRLPFIENTISSIQQQTYKPDKLYLSLPEVFARDGTTYGELPHFLVSAELVEVVRCKTDFATITSVLCVLHLEQNPWTYFVIIDDDAMYHPRLLDNLLRTQLKRKPGCAIGQVGNAEEAEANPYDGTTIGPFLTQSFGAIYQRRMFDRRVFGHGQMLGAERECLHHGDVWFGAHLATKGIKRIGLADQFAIMFMDYSNWTDSLIHGGNTHCPPANSTGTSNEHCARICNTALLRAFGESLWQSRPRRVAVLSVDDPHTAGLALRRVLHSDAVLFVLHGAAAEFLLAESVERQSFGFGAEAFAERWLMTGDVHDDFLRHSLLYTFHMDVTSMNIYPTLAMDTTLWQPGSHDAGLATSGPTVELFSLEGDVAWETIKSHTYNLLLELEENPQTVIFFASAKSVSSLERFEEITECASAYNQICCVRGGAVSITIAALSDEPDCLQMWTF